MLDQFKTTYSVSIQYNTYNTMHIQIKNVLCADYIWKHSTLFIQISIELVTYT